MTLTKHLSHHVPSETNGSLPSVLTLQSLGDRAGRRALDSIRDPFPETQTDFSTTQHPANDPTEPISSGHVLRLRPEHQSGREVMDGWVAPIEPQAGTGSGLVFEEAESEEMDVEEGRGGVLGEEVSRSRSRRSWIWNQFFVIEEYAGPEPVLIGRVRFIYLPVLYAAAQG